MRRDSAVILTPLSTAGLGALFLIELEARAGIVCSVYSPQDIIPILGCLLNLYHLIMSQVFSF